MAGSIGSRPDAAAYVLGKGKPGGRPKGSPNKIGAKVKQNVIAVFEEIGGIKAMTNWARRNKTEFYKLYARLIPTQVTATVDVRHASEFSDEELIAVIVEGTSRPGIALEAPSDEQPDSVH